MLQQKRRLSDIRKEVSGAKGRFVLVAPEGEAELTYSRASPTLVVADHTAGPDAMRGTGAGLALVEALIADARVEGYKIMPLCPFVNAERKKHPEWANAFNV